MPAVRTFTPREPELEPLFLSTLSGRERKRIGALWDRWRLLDRKADLAFELGNIDRGEELSAMADEADARLHEALEEIGSESEAVFATEIGLEDEFAAVYEEFLHGAPRGGGRGVHGDRVELGRLLRMIASGLGHNYLGSAVFEATDEDLIAAAAMAYRGRERTMARVRNARQKR